MASCPIVRQRTLEALTGRGSVRGASLTELKDKLGLIDISVTQFIKALGSLCYKHGEVAWGRFRPEEDAAGIDGGYARSHVITLK